MNSMKSSIFFLAFICLFVCSFAEVVKSENTEPPLSNEVKEDCPNDAAFVTTCSGKDGDDPNTNAKAEAHSGEFDESILVDEIMEEMESDRNQQQPFQSKDEGNSKWANDANQDDDETSIAIQHLKDTLGKFSQRYHDLPPKGKCAIGAACGFTSSRLALGVANRLFRFAGATWVVAEVLHTSGFCDESKCIPGEVRPWIGIARRSLVKQCNKVRMLARKVWDQDRIRDIVQNDAMGAGGFAAGAFVGFVI